MTKYIPGNPTFIIQNMPGASSMIAANYVFTVAKPDGLTLGWIAPTLYFDQLVGRKEVQYDWAKYSFIGSPSESEHHLYMRTDSPYKTIEDVRKASEPPKCGSGGATGTGFYFPKLLEETVGAKFNIVLGYQGGGPIDLAVEKGEIHCRAMTIESFFAREPFHTWRKTNFVRSIAQSARKRDARLPDTPTIYELMDQYKTADQSRRVATVILAGDVFGRPMVGPAGIPADRLKILRSAFASALKDPELKVEAEKRSYELDPAAGEEMEKLAKKAWPSLPPWSKE
jgi:tripartite-type tricarboxylate transporter receptor subunit TctC